jgi:hypothetical protein
MYPYPKAADNRKLVCEKRWLTYSGPNGRDIPVGEYGKGNAVVVYAPEFYSATTSLATAVETIWCVVAVDGVTCLTEW